MKAAGYDPYDSSGTDDDLPPVQNRGLRGRSFSGNGRVPIGTFPYMKAHHDLESEIHRVEQDAYTGVLRAFKVQSDAISWEKESLITELRKELRVSDEEHRELLNKVNEDGSIRRMRELRQGGGTQSGLHRGSRALYDAEPGSSAKRQKTSHLIPSQSASLQSPIMHSHSVPSAKWGPLSARSKKAKTMAPEDIRWDFEGHGISNRDGWGPSGPALKRHPSNNGAMAGRSRGRGRFSTNDAIKDYVPPQNGIDSNIDHIDIPNTESVVIEVERVLSNPNMREIEKARKLLKDQEQSLLDAIARLDEASDSESVDMATEGRMGSAGDHMGRNGIAC
ncbi:protein EMSY-LIKE 1-like isoform X5 [Phragmites australis]|uniref:protein EMSY-LIKE 1-like isoform X5 n=1 Tax=Phragmites australis TaxID=29695 RepID=UPI002D77425E|nr:protein EMSY-LIKE 1-like isoform X5 [Phragmites australis]